MEGMEKIHVLRGVAGLMRRNPTRAFHRHPGHSRLGFPRISPHGFAAGEPRSPGNATCEKHRADRGHGDGEIREHDERFRQQAERHDGQGNRAVSVPRRGVAGLTREKPGRESHRHPGYSRPGFPRVRSGGFAAGELCSPATPRRRADWSFREAKKVFSMPSRGSECFLHVLHVSALVNQQAWSCRTTASTTTPSDPAAEAGSWAAAGGSRVRRARSRRLRRAAESRGPHLH